MLVLLNIFYMNLQIQATFHDGQEFGRSDCT